MFLLLWHQPIVVQQPATGERYYSPLIRSKYNVYIPDDIPLEEALLLWWQIINSD